MLLALISDDKHGLNALESLFLIFGSALRDRSIQVENNKNRRLGLRKG